MTNTSSHSICSTALSLRCDAARYADAVSGMTLLGAPRSRSWLPNELDCPSLVRSADSGNRYRKLRAIYKNLAYSLIVSKNYASGLKMSMWGLIGVGALIWGAVYIWKKHFIYKKMGLGEGRKFGNQIADAIGIEHNLFHSAFEVAAPGPSLFILEGMRRQGVNPMTAAMDLSPYLLEGVEKLEARFGPQRQLDHARAIFTRLLKLANDEANRIERETSSH